MVTDEGVRKIKGEAIHARNLAESPAEVFRDGTLLVRPLSLLDGQTP